MTGGWLKEVVKNSDVNTFGVFQILACQEKNLGENVLTLFKVSDGKCVTWQVTAVPTIQEEFKHLATRLAIVEVTKATIHHGYRLIVEEYVLLEEEVSTEVIIEDELEFLEREFYQSVFVDKGMLDQQKQRVKNHPGFQLTPVRMTRSKTKENLVLPNKKKLKTGGFQCDRCEKKYKTEKWFNVHNCT